MAPDIDAYLDSCRADVDAYLREVLPPPQTFPARLFESMHYSLFAGGKRIRPAFCFASYEAVGGQGRKAVPCAAALEMIHTYSLIHDDLPAMDDDDLRRGKPTNHVVFGDGIAILAGDGLLTDAFSVMTRQEVVAALGPERVVRIVGEIARAAGSSGMVAGQALDLESEGIRLDLPTLEFLHTHKTGALIRAAVAIGAIAGGASEDDRARLERYGASLGLAFQIADDVLDVEGATEVLGKTAGSDQNLSKATYPALLGLAESKRRARDLMGEAIASLDPFGPSAESLRALARFVVDRRH